MSVESDSSPESGYSALDTAADQLLRTQTALFNSAAQWVRIPVSTNKNNLVNATNVSSEAFAAYSLAIICSGIEIPQMAGSLAMITVDTSARRIAAFKKLTPAAQFQPLEFDEIWLAQRAETDFDEIGEQGTAQKFVDLYTNNVIADLNTLSNAVRSTTKGKILCLTEGAKDHAMEFGKLTAAATLGGLAAHAISSRRTLQ
jgi:hypothetical protein